MVESIKFSSATKLNPGFGYLVSHGKRKWEFLNFSELCDEDITDLSRSIRFSSTKRNIVTSAATACRKATKMIKIALATYSDPPHWFPFLKLPREIRDMIYKAVLIKPYDIDVGYGFYQKIGENLAVKMLKIELPIFRVCKLVYQEAYPIFFAHNSFHITYGYGMRKIITNQISIREIHELSIDWEGINLEGSKKLFKELKNLKVLHVRGPTYWTENKPLLCSNFVSQLMKLRGLQKFSFTERRNDPTGIYKRESTELEGILQRVTLYSD